MTVTVAYFEKKNEIRICFTCNHAKVRIDILENLEKAGVKVVRDNGGDIYVSADKFSSTADLEQKVFSGFTVIAASQVREHYDPIGTKMEIAYVDVISVVKKTPNLTLFQTNGEEIGNCNSPKEEEVDAAPRINSKDLLDQHYGAKQSPQI